MDQSVWIGIDSFNESTSFFFSLRVIEVIQKLQNSPLNTIAISTNKDYEKYVPFSNIREWSFINSTEKLDELYLRKINTFILSEDFFKWDSCSDCLNDDLSIFERSLLENKVNVILIGSFNFSRFDHFRDVNHRWYDDCLSEILKIMISDFIYEPECLVLGIPKVTIDPELFDVPRPGSTMKTLISFQPWSYEQLPYRYGKIEHGIIHTWKHRGYEDQVDGPIAIELKL